MMEDHIKELEKKHESAVYQMNTEHQIQLAEVSNDSTLKRLQNQLNKSEMTVSELRTELYELNSEYEQNQRNQILARDQLADSERQSLLSRALRAEAKARDLELQLHQL